MSELKQGDRVWVKVTVAEVFGERFMIAELHCQNGEYLPDAPALATVARWLHDTPQAAEAARKALKHLTTYGFLPPDEQAAMMTLVTALTPTHGASDD